MKIKVQTEKGEETLVLTPEEYDELKLEMSGEKRSVSEYKTINGEIITDLDIISIK